VAAAWQAAVGEGTEMAGRAKEYMDQNFGLVAGGLQQAQGMAGAVERKQASERPATEFEQFLGDEIASKWLGAAQRGEVSWQDAAIAARLEKQQQSQVQAGPMRTVPSGTPGGMLASRPGAVMGAPQPMVSEPLQPMPQGTKVIVREPPKDREPPKEQPQAPTPMFKRPQVKTKGDFDAAMQGADAAAKLMPRGGGSGLTFEERMALAQLGMDREKLRAAAAMDRAQVSAWLKQQKIDLGALVEQGRMERFKNSVSEINNAKKLQQQRYSLMESLHRANALTDQEWKAFAIESENLNEAQSSYARIVDAIAGGINEDDPEVRYAAEFLLSRIRSLNASLDAFAKQKGLRQGWAAPGAEGPLSRLSDPGLPTQPSTPQPSSSETVRTKTSVTK